MNILTSIDPEAGPKYRARLHLPQDFFVHVTFLEEQEDAQPLHASFAVQQD